jgi:uncharacterized membrane protein YfcA
MSDAAEIAQHGGAFIAVASAGAGYANSVMGWLNHNSAGILALCGIGGMIISWLGYRAKRRHERELLEHELRMKQRRQRQP